MIELRPCTGDHIRQIDVQDAQALDEKYGLRDIDDLIANSLAISGWHNGMCIGAAGIQPIWEGRAFGWALLGRTSGHVMLGIVRSIRFFLTACPVNRVEMTVRENFPEGCRLAGLLGFDAEARLAGFFPDGSTAILYARIRHE